MGVTHEVKQLRGYFNRGKIGQEGRKMKSMETVWASRDERGRSWKLRGVKIITMGEKL